MAMMERQLENGFAFIYILIAAAIILAVALASFGGFSTLLRLTSKEKTSVQTQNLHYYFRLLFKEPAGCKAGLLKDTFLEELKKKIQNPSCSRDHRWPNRDRQQIPSRSEYRHTHRQPRSI
jgi:hypothetical protein